MLLQCCTIYFVWGPRETAETFATCWTQLHERESTCLGCLPKSKLRTTFVTIVDFVVYESRRQHFLGPLDPWIWARCIPASICHLWAQCLSVKEQLRSSWLARGGYKRSQKSIDMFESNLNTIFTYINCRPGGRHPWYYSPGTLTPSRAAEIKALLKPALRAVFWSRWGVHGPWAESNK